MLDPTRQRVTACQNFDSAEDDVETQSNMEVAQELLTLLVPLLEKLIQRLDGHDDQRSAEGRHHGSHKHKGHKKAKGGGEGDVDESEFDSNSANVVHFAGNNLTGGSHIPTAVAGVNSGGSTLAASAPAALQQWKPYIERAAEVTGLDANLIAAVIWAESRGNPNDPSSNPETGAPDLGLMQIGETGLSDMSDPQLQQLARQQDLNDSGQNILAGSLELLDKIRRTGSIEKGLGQYVGHDQATYISDVMEFYDSLQEGTPLRD